MDWPIDRERLLKMDRGIPRYEQIAGAIESAIVSGRLRSGERLSTVRELAAQLGVSGTTIAAAYNLLSDKGWIRSEVGRGTFVNSPRIGGAYVDAAKVGRHGNAMTVNPLGAPDSQRARHGVPTVAPWRRRALMNSAARLRSVYPDLA